MQAAHPDVLAAIDRERTGIAHTITTLACRYLQTYRLDALEAINDGQCDEFAHDVARLVDGARAVWDDDLDPDHAFAGGHCFVLYEGRFYDAETPEGVDRFDDLPFYARCRDHAAARAAVRAALCRDDPDC